jgi:adhesin HecA-like repeat protein
MPSHIRIATPKIIHMFVLLSYLFHAVAPALATSVIGAQDDCFHMGVRTSVYQKGKYAYPQITLTTRSGEESESLTITPFTPLHKGLGMRALFDEQNRSLGFTYGSQTLGQMMICWDGSLLLNNLKVAVPHLRIETDGSILLKEVSGGNVQLQGRDIYFNGTNRFDALSLSFNDQGAARMAHVLPKSALIAQELSLYSGLFLNDGEVSVSAQSFMHGSHLVNEGDFKTGTLQFDAGGTLKNKGTLKSTMITARFIDNLENYGPITSDFEITSKRIINTGSIQGTGTMRAESFINEGLMGDEATVVRVSQKGVNLGILKAHRIGGGGHFKNHHKLQVQELSVSDFTNQPDETLKETATVEGESLHLTRHVRTFTNDRDATIETKRLTMEKRERNPRVITNRGLINGKDVTLIGTVSNTGAIEANDFTWEGDTFLTHDLDATKARLKGDIVTNRGNLEIASGSMDVNEFVNMDTASIKLTESSTIHTLTNQKDLTLRGGAEISDLINGVTARLFIEEGRSGADKVARSHFVKQPVQFKAQEPDDWISFRVNPSLLGPLNTKKPVEISINGESYFVMVKQTHLDNSRGILKLQLGNNFILPVIQFMDCVELSYHSPHMDFEIVRVMNKGKLQITNVPLLLTYNLHNEKDLTLKNSSLCSLATENAGTMTLDGTGDHRLVDLENEGTLRFTVPVWLENASKWKKPGCIEGAYGVHIPTESLNPLPKATLSLLPRDTLYFYGKNVKSTKDTQFNHRLSITAETFNNNHTIGAPKVQVDAATFNNNGTIKVPETHVNARTTHNSRTIKKPKIEVNTETFNNSGTLKGRYVTVHATESGQNPGRLEATRRLDLDLPQIDSLGIMISGRDLFFKTKDRTITLIEDQSWLNVGRDLHMDLGNGNFKVEAKHAFPGDVKVKANSFNLKGELEAAGDINIKAQGDIELKAKTYEIKPPLSTQDLWLQALGHPIFNFNPEPPTYEYVLSKLTSGGALSLAGQNVNNFGGQVYGAQSLRVDARNNSTNGTRVEIMRSESRIGHANGGLFHYKVPEAKGIGTYFATLGPLSLTAGFAFQNIHGTLFAGDTLSITGPHFMTNMAGQIISVGDAYLQGGTFSNSREPVVTVATGPANNGDHNHRWYVNGDLKYSGKNNGPEQEFAGSRPATLQTLGDLTLDFSSKIANQMSEIIAGGSSHIMRARVENKDPAPLSAWIRREGDGSWPKYTVNAGILMSTMSSNKTFTITTPQEVLNGGMISSPQIYVKGPRLLQIGSQDSTTHLSHRSSMRTMGGVDCIPLAPYARQLGEGLRTIMGSLPHPSFPDITVIMDQNTRVTLSMSRLLSSPYMDMFALQRGYMDHYRKGYLWPHLSPLEHMIRLRENGRRMALQHGARESDWTPLMITEAEASKTVLPMLLYRPIVEDGREGLAAEYWGPRHMIQSILLEDEAAVMGDTVFNSNAHTTSVTGNVHGGNEVRLSGHEGFLGHRIEHQQTPHGYIEKPVGGNITTDKEGEVDIQFEGPFKTSGGTITAEDGTVSIASNGMDLDTAVTRTYHNDGETLIDDTTQHPLHIESGDIRVNSSSYLNAAAIQGIASRTLNMLAQDDIAFPSAENTHHFEQSTSDRDPFGGKSTRTEVSHSTTHQVANLTAGTLMGVRSATRNIAGTAPVFTAPKIVLDFQNGALLLQAFKNTYFHNIETLDKNAFFISSGVEGFSSTQHMGPQINTDKIITSNGRPIEVDLTEEQLKDPNTFIKHLQQQGADIDIIHNAFQSWNETKMSVGPGLSALIAIGVSLVMPGIGIGVPGAMATAGAKAVTTQTLVGLVNHQGNPLEALKDLTSGDSLRSLATTILSAGLTRGVCNVLELPTDIGIEKTPLEHIEVAAIRATVNGAFNAALMGKDVDDVLKDVAIDTVVDSVGAIGAQQISHWYRDHDLNTFTHKVTHAFLGGATGALLSDDPLQGAMSGALGAVVAETFVELTTKSAEDLSLEILEEEWSKGRNPSKEDLKQRMQEQLQYKSDLGRLSATVAAIATDQDVTIASKTAANAVENNYITLMIGVACTTYEIYEGVQLWVSGDKEGALLHFGIVAGTAAVGGSIARVGGKLASKVAGKVAPTAVEILEAYKTAHPGFAQMFDKVVHLVEKGLHKVQAADTYVTQKVDSALKRVVPKKRPTLTAPEDIEDAVIPKTKVQHTQDKTSPGASSASNNATEGIIPPSHQLEYHGASESFQSRALQLQQNRIEGRGFQGSVLEWLRITENKTSHTVFVQGKGHVTTIPDLPIEWGVSEIKNVKYISFTKQLQAQAALAKEKITSFNLIISPNTEKISVPLWDNIRRSKGKIFEFNPTTQTMVERFLDGNKILR